MRGAATGHERRSLDQCACPKCRAAMEPVRYLVDVASWMGHGECSCPHFQMKFKPEVERGRTKTPLRCKHLHAAFYKFGEMKAAEVGEAPQPT